MKERSFFSRNIEQVMMHPFFYGKTNKSHTIIRNQIVTVFYILNLNLQKRISVTVVTGHRHGCYRTPCLHFKVTEHIMSLIIKGNINQQALKITTHICLM